MTFENENEGKLWEWLVGRFVDNEYGAGPAMQAADTIVLGKRARQPAGGTEGATSEASSEMARAMMREYLQPAEELRCQLDSLRRRPTSGSAEEALSRAINEQVESRWPDWQGPEDAK